jgi:hypothetical protein
MKKNYAEFCESFDAPNSKVPHGHGNRGGGTILTTITRIALT